MMDTAQLKKYDVHYWKKKIWSTKNKYLLERQNIEKHPHKPVFSENLFIELLLQFGTQLENGNTIWWDKSKNAGVLLILWREKMKYVLQIRNNWCRKQCYLKVGSISCRTQKNLKYFRHRDDIFKCRLKLLRGNFNTTQVVCCVDRG